MTIVAVSMDKVQYFQMNLSAYSMIEFRLAGFHAQSYAGSLKTCYRKGCKFHLSLCRDGVKEGGLTENVYGLVYVMDKVTSILWVCARALETHFCKSSPNSFV
ncbi:hypothetical protein QE152_g27198 [Popillia japonica]|uniref:Uncharacterized protein n=1 Tax=Popillia japonica TaxID=7064 RepID=A0AAW1JVT3_POPJA